MAKYIDVDINPADYVTVWDVDGEYGKQTVMAVEDLQYLPAADVAPVVHAKVVEKTVKRQVFNMIQDRRFQACSACDKELGIWYQVKYCPFCGAKLDLPDGPADGWKTWKLKPATETIGYADESGLAPAT